MLAFVWSFGETCAVWLAHKYPQHYKRLAQLAERFTLEEQHHKNVTLSRRRVWLVARFRSRSWVWTSLVTVCRAAEWGAVGWSGRERWW